MGTYLDGQLIFPSSGGWDWIALDECMGPGGYDSGASGFYRYRLPSGPAQFTSALAATEFFANAMGSWVRYLADGRTGSTDSSGRSWPDRVAVGFEGVYEIFTDPSRIPLIFFDITTGQDTVVANPSEWTLLPDKSTYFSRNYRGIYFGGVFWACGYLPNPGGLCIWRPFRTDLPTYLLSNTGTDFNPDISQRAAQNSGLLLVGSGDNQGETSQHLYEIELDTLQFRKDNGLWQPLTTGPTPPQPEPPDPIPPEPEPIPPQPIPPDPIPPQPVPTATRSLVVLSLIAERFYGQTPGASRRTDDRNSEGGAAHLGETAHGRGQWPLHGDPGESASTQLHGSASSRNDPQRRRRAGKTGDR